MPRTESHEGIALRTENPADRIALRGVRVAARLSGMGLRAVVEQTFVNLESRAIEAVYTFPLPESAAVCGFEVVTADRVLTGVIEESGKAEETYQEAIDAGHGAFLAEQHRPDVFSARAGNLKPGQAATVRLTYICPLEQVDRQIRIAFPTTIAPRYTTATGTDPIDAAIDGDALNPPHVLCVPYGLSLSVEVDLGRPLTGILSPSHAIDVSPTRDGRSTITLSAGVGEMNRDLVLSLWLAGDPEPRVQTAAGPDGANYLAVSFVPVFEPAEREQVGPSETVFVLDCSGSMMGDSIRQATAALELCLRSLSAGDRFNICRFGSSFELMASEPMPYTQQTLDAALRYVRATRDLGGTELFEPLQAVLSVPPRAGSVRQVILLTDGQVSNEPAILQLCRSHRATNRIFSFGIGSACSAFLVNGVARATGGAAEFITEGERIDDKVLRTFARLVSPTVSDVAIDWGGADVQTLAEIPPVMDGDVMRVYGRCAGRLPESVSLTCTAAGRPKRWKLSVPAAMANDQNTLATLWARRTIQSLEEVNGPAVVRHHAGQPSREQAMLIQLSKTFGLLSSLTSFVCVEHRSRADRNAGAPELRRVPLQLAEGWGGVETDMLLMRASAPMAPRGAMPAMAAPASAPPPPKPGEPRKKSRLANLRKRFSRKSSYADVVDDGSLGSGPDPLGEASVSFDDSMEYEAAPAAGGGASPVSDLAGLLNLQQFDGSFGGHGVIELKSLLGVADGPALDALIRRNLPQGYSGDVETIVRTVAVLLMLHVRFGGDQGIWSRAAGKAVRQYLSPNLHRAPAEIEQWIADLRRMWVP
jgi:Ca-activated chloride channel family protein